MLAYYRCVLSSLQYCHYTPHIGLIATECQVAMSLYHDSFTVWRVSIPCLLTITLKFMTPPQSDIPHHYDSSFLLPGQRCTRPRLQGAQATKFCRVAPNIGFWVGNFLHVMLMAPKIWGGCQIFGKSVQPCIRLSVSLYHAWLHSPFVAGRWQAFCIMVHPLVRYVVYYDLGTKSSKPCSWRQWFCREIICSGHFFYWSWLAVGWWCWCWSRLVSELRLYILIPRVVQSEPLLVFS